MILLQNKLPLSKAAFSIPTLAENKRMNMKQRYAGVKQTDILYSKNEILPSNKNDFVYTKFRRLHPSQTSLGYTGGRL